MKYSLIRFWSLLIIGMMVELPVHATDVPDTWLDSLEVNLWRLKSGMDVQSYRVLTIEQKLDKHGEPKDSDTTYFLVEIGDSRQETYHQTDSNGTILKRNVRVMEHQDNDQEETSNKNQATLRLDPFDPIKAKYRDSHRFWIEKDTIDSQLVIGYEPLENAETGFAAHMTIDTTKWVALRIEGAPVPFPKGVKDMHLDLNFELIENGEMRMSYTDTRVYAKFLLLKFRMRIQERYFDYK